MTVGATDTWTQTRDEIISDALANVGAIGPGVDATGKPRDFAARALNRLVKALDAEGQFLWRISRKTLTTIDGTAGYALDATCFAVDEPMDYYDGTTRTPILPMSRDEYMALSTRTQEGMPNRYFIERTITGGGLMLLTAYFWPVPDTSSKTIEYAATLRAKDYTTGATTSDFPTAWIACLVYGLTAEIAPAFSQPDLAQFYAARYENEKNKLIGADNEQMGLTLVPFGGF